MNLSPTPIKMTTNRYHTNISQRFNPLRCEQKTIQPNEVSNTENRIKDWLNGLSYPRDEILDNIARNRLIPPQDFSLRDILVELQQQGFEVNRVNELGRTALLSAAQHNHIPLLKLLLKENMNINLQDHNEDTALMLAIGTGNKAVAGILIRSQCDVNLHDNKGETALFKACRQGSLYFVKRLISSKCNVNIQNTEGLTALHVAIQMSHDDIISILLKEKIQSDLKTDGGLTALHFASVSNYSPILEMLLRAGFNPNVQDNTGNTSLHLACFMGRTNNVKYLIKSNCNINTQDQNGESALHFACTMQRRESIIELLESNADLALQNNENETASKISLDQEDESSAYLIEAIHHLETFPTIDSVEGDHREAIIEYYHEHKETVDEVLINRLTFFLTHASSPEPLKSTLSKLPSTELREKVRDNILKKMKDRHLYRFSPGINQQLSVNKDSILGLSASLGFLTIQETGRIRTLNKLYSDTITDRKKAYTSNTLDLPKPPLEQVVISWQLAADRSA